MTYFRSNDCVITNDNRESKCVFTVYVTTLVYATLRSIDFLFVFIFFNLFCLAAILSKIIAHRKQLETAVDIEMQCDMLFILSAICENDVHRKVNNTLFILRFHFVIDQQRHHTAILYL